MSNTVHSEAVARVENALKSNGIAIAGFTGVVVNTVDDPVEIGGNIIPAGKFAVVECKAVVTITE